MTIERKQVPSLGRIVLVREIHKGHYMADVEVPGLIYKVHDAECVDIWVANDYPNLILVAVPFNKDMEKTTSSTPTWRWPPFVPAQGAAVSQMKVGTLDVSVPVAPSSYLDRLIMELSELTDRRQKLGKFFSHPDFMALSAENKTLLDQQQVVMDSYIRILDRRISLAEKT